MLTAVALEICAVVLPSSKSALRALISMDPDLGVPDVDVGNEEVVLERPKERSMVRLEMRLPVLIQTIFRPRGIDGGPMRCCGRSQRQSRDQCVRLRSNDRDSHEHKATIVWLAHEIQRKSPSYSLS